MRCVHRWVIDTDGLGECRKCGLSRQFENTFEEDAGYRLDEFQDEFSPRNWRGSNEWDNAVKSLER